MNDDWDAADWEDAFGGPEDDQIDALHELGWASVEYQPDPRSEVLLSSRDSADESVDETDDLELLLPPACEMTPWQPLDEPGASASDSEHFAALGSAMRSDEAELRLALSRLRHENVDRFEIRFLEGEFDEGEVASVLPPSSNVPSSDDIIESLTTCCRRAGIFLLGLNGLNVSNDHFDCNFEFIFNLKSDMLDYRAYKRAPVQLSEFKGTWDLRNGQLFQDLSKHPGFLPWQQGAFFNNISRGLANLIVIDFNTANHSEVGHSASSYFRADARDIAGYHYSNQRPDWNHYMQSMLQTLCYAVAETVPKSSLKPGAWRGSHRIDIDYASGVIRYQQFEFEWYTKDLAVGILPISEFVWMALERTEPDVCEDRFDVDENLFDD